jgi:hypothetical protein
VGESHLKAELTGDGASLDAIGFGLADRYPPASLDGAPHDVLFRVERNEWRGRARAQAKLVALRRRVAGP